MSVWLLTMRHDTETQSYSVTLTKRDPLLRPVWTATTATGLTVDEATCAMITTEKSLKMCGVMVDTCRATA